MTRRPALVRLVAAALATSTLLLGLLTATTTSSAPLPDAPGGLSPSGSDTSAVPTLSWDRIGSATRYLVRVSPAPEARGG